MTKKKNNIALIITIVVIVVLAGFILYSYFGGNLRMSPPVTKQAIMGPPEFTSTDCLGWCISKYLKCADNARGEYYICMGPIDERLKECLIRNGKIYDSDINSCLKNAGSISYGDCVHLRNGQVNSPENPSCYNCVQTAGDNAKKRKDACRSNRDREGESCGAVFKMMIGRCDTDFDECRASCDNPAHT